MIGQGLYSGTFMSNTFKGVPEDKKIEFVVAEQMQSGVMIGMGMSGLSCLSVFPRFNFLILGMSEIVNLLDKLPEITENECRPKVIIRVGVGVSKRPGVVYPGIQHSGDFTEAFKSMLTTIDIVELREPEQIFLEYEKAYYKKGSTMLVEYGDYYELK